MKYFFIALIGATTLGTSLSAAAAPDQIKVCPPKKLVLPLDHGLRAQTTPYLNQLRKARYQAEVNACKEAAR